MARFVIATINGEWMNDWFMPDGTDGAAWRPTFVRDGVECDTERAAGLLAGLIADIGADVVALQEAPSRAAELALFLDTHLAGRYRFLIGDGGGSQKLALLAGATVEAELVPAAGLAGRRRRRRSRERVRVHARPAGLPVGARRQPTRGGGRPPQVELHQPR
jgi:hypothetical protein